jgi:hypothetical protein
MRHDHRQTLRATAALVLLAASLAIGAPAAHAQGALKNASQDAAATGGTGQSGKDLGRGAGLRHEHTRPESATRPGLVGGDSILSSSGGAGGNAAGAGTMPGSAAAHTGGGFKAK